MVSGASTAMNSDPSSLSAEPFVYFLLHSSLFVMAIAAVFGVLGLFFGWLTWGKYRLRLRESIAERDGFKTEIAGLKRKLAELATRLSQQQPDNAADSPAAAPPSIGKSDPVIGSFLATASSLLSRRTVMPEPARRLGLPAGKPIGARAEEDTGKEPLPGEEDRSGKGALTSPIHGADQPHVDKSGDGASASQTAASPEESGTPGEEPAHEPFSSPRAATDTAAEPAAAHSGNGSSAHNEPGLTCDPQLGMIYRAAPAQADDLTHLKGVASIIEGRLNEFGVFTFRQIAVWSDENVREFSSRLAFKDRIFRENWRDQARELHFQKYGERLE